ncbi:hypothetical protein DESPIGER_0071 [Desulfovibrio piger]|uniref:Uncharacterized protein n=1 Tax=Desulfovibrio piger TaxID=901 RepID=A0A1K1LEW6_9BACT|nr:hypothetical protein DESPIGER_0071 [Desulfovibrio piger]
MGVASATSEDSAASDTAGVFSWVINILLDRQRRRNLSAVIPAEGTAGHPAKAGGRVRERTRARGCPEGAGHGGWQEKTPVTGRRFPGGRNSRRRGNVRKRGTGPRHDGRDQTVCPPRKRLASLITIFKDAQLHG